jgi:hypothetical protein
MEALNYLREEIKSYFFESTELQLSSAFANHRRFNFYFEIATGQPYLLYLSWEGDDERFTLKCLEFSVPDILKKLIAAYTNIGSKAFNIGQPRSTISFFYLGKDRLSALDYKGVINGHIDSSEISGRQLMGSINPFS